MSKLLINESPLIVLPSLVRALGTIERAVALQQMHFVATISDTTKDEHGHEWFRASYDDLCAKWFPMWSPHTLSKHIRHLEERGCVVSHKAKRTAWDQTKSYRIDHAAVALLVNITSVTPCINDDTGCDDVERTGSGTLYNVPDPVVSSIERSRNNKETEPKVVVVVEKPNAMAAYESNIGALTSHIGDMINDAVDEYGDTWCVDAIHIATTAEHRSWKYVLGILKNWKRDGRTEPESMLESIDDREQQTFIDPTTGERLEI